MIDSLCNDVKKKKRGENHSLLVFQSMLFNGIHSKMVAIIGAVVACERLGPIGLH